MPEEGDDMPIPGFLISQTANKIEAEKKLGTTILFYQIMDKKVHPRNMKSITCPHCGVSLEVHKIPRLFKCPSCRAVRRPCDRCDAFEDCAMQGCCYDTGENPEEAVQIVRRGSK